MIICGIKFTHDASVAIIEDGRLRSCVEVEKLNNNKRYAEIEDVQEVRDILELQGLAPKDVDRFVIDGWHGSGTFRRGDSVLSQRHGKLDLALPVASYNEISIKDNVLARLLFKDGLPIGDTRRDYASYMHVAAHIMGTYCASPYAQSDEPAYVLAWDGGQYPRLYYVDPRQKTVANKGRLFCLLGTVYSVMGHYFGPYKRSAEQLAQDKVEQTFEGYFGGYSIAGKLMSYIALGQVQQELLLELPKIFEREFDVGHTFEHKFQQAILRFVAGRGYADADVLLTQHTFIERLLVSSLRARVAKDRMAPQNFCFTGGSALNIKWNSAIRSSGVFRSTWVAPYPNDCGNGLGAACCEMVTQGGPWVLHWSVYCGPAMPSASPLPGWRARPCNIDELAGLLAETGDPVVFLNGAAEIGPRALGNRSILAPAVDPQMKTMLNRVKKREDFRPVAPICMQEHAPGIFDPGTHDPHMLFDHHVRSAWRERIPAVCHLDGTARLQTVNAAENHDIYRLLEAYHRRTGIPLLCNTSANLNGSGFFPDAQSAMRWGGVSRIYCNGTLFDKVAG